MFKKWFLEFHEFLWTYWNVGADEPPEIEEESTVESGGVHGV